MTKKKKFRKVIISTIKDWNLGIIFSDKIIIGFKRDQVDFYTLWGFF